MTSVREWIKRNAPRSARKAFIDLRARFEPPSLEEIVLHTYDVRRSSDPTLRLSLVIPSLAPEQVFAGVSTGVELFLECGRRTQGDLRIVLDNFDRSVDTAFLQKAARKVGLNPDRIEINLRSATVEPLDVRKNDFFMAFNWWTTLNLAPVVRQQQVLFACEQRPLLYILQEYEPQFYSFSSTHMFARAALALPQRVWGIFNSSQLHKYFRAQGHRFEQEHVFEPRLSASMRPFLASGPIPKERRILVYGRPTIGRNCFSAIVNGLRMWSERSSGSAQWNVASAGLPHRPVAIGRRRPLESLGKMPIEDYANLLRSTALGISLMSSPHPSYPPLEMAHFGVITLTNGYFCKDLSLVHDNIVSMSGIDPETIAAALEAARLRFEAAPDAGWSAKSRMPDYLDEGPYAFLDALADDIRALAA